MYITKPVCWRGVVFVFFLWDIPSPKLTWPLKMVHPKRKRSSSNHPVSGAFAVSLGRGESFWGVCKPRIAKNLQQPKGARQNVFAQKPSSISMRLASRLCCESQNMNPKKPVGRLSIPFPPPFPLSHRPFQHRDIAKGKVVRRNPPTWGSWRRRNGVISRWQSILQGTPSKLLPEKVYIPSLKTNSKSPWKCSNPGNLEVPIGNHHL